MTAPLATPSSFRSTTTAAERPSLGTTALGALAGGALATAAALVVHAVAGSGAPVRVITGWAPDGTDLGVPDVVVTTVVSVLIAAVGLAILERFTGHGLRTWTIAVSVVTVLSSLPLWRLDIDTRSKVALTIMHLVVGAAVVGGQLLVRRADR